MVPWLVRETQSACPPLRCKLPARESGTYSERCTMHLHQVSVIWSSDIWSFQLYGQLKLLPIFHPHYFPDACQALGESVFGYMVNLFQYFGYMVFGYMVILAIWSILAGQNHGPYIRNPVYV